MTRKHLLTATVGVQSIFGGRRDGKDGVCGATPQELLKIRCSEVASGARN